MNVRFVLSVMALFCSTVAVGAENKNSAEDNKIVRGVVKVAANNDEWTATTIKVVPGDILLTLEPGSKIVVGAYMGKTDANGLDRDIGALQLKTGAGSVQKVGTKGFVIVTEPGTVKLRVNDTNYRDNSGEFAVNIIRIPAALMPTAKDVSVE